MERYRNADYRILSRMLANIMNEECDARWLKLKLIFIILLL